MPPLPSSIVDFLAGRRIAVAGVSRSGRAPANAIFRRLRECGYEVVPVNPNASELEGMAAYPSVSAVPGELDGVLVAAHPSAGVAIVREAAARGIRRIWFHRSFGDGSVSADALAECRKAGIEPVVGGCPLMYCGRVDPAHRFFRWWLGLLRRLPG